MAEEFFDDIENKPKQSFKDKFWAWYNKANGIFLKQLKYKYGPEGMNYSMVLNKYNLYLNEKNNKDEDFFKDDQISANANRSNGSY